MDDRPPPYEDTYSNNGNGGKRPGQNNEKQPWSFSDQVMESRAWLVSVAAGKVYTVLEQRAICGISKTTLMLVPSGQDCDVSGEISIAGFDDKPATVELSEQANSAEFWSQNQAVEELRRQVAVRMGSGRGARVQARLDDVHVRYESAFGLYESKRITAIVLRVQ